MIKITGFEHISIGAEDTEPSASVLGLFGIKPLYGEDIHPHGVTTTYYEHENNEKEGRKRKSKGRTTTRKRKGT